MSNPYEAPASLGTLAEERAPVLYTPGQAAWAAFLASPMAGCLLLAINYRRVGRLQASFVTLAVGTLATILVFVIAYLVPDNFPSMVFPTLYVLGMLLVASYLQGDHFKRDLPHGHRRASNWAATGIACLVMLFLLILFAVFLAVPD